MVSPSSVVIIGAEAAGGAAAEMLRRQGYSDVVTLIGVDEFLPYDPPNLFKDYLAGSALGRMDSASIRRVLSRARNRHAHRTGSASERWVAYRARELATFYRNLTPSACSRVSSVFVACPFDISATVPSEKPIDSVASGTSGGSL